MISVKTKTHIGPDGRLMLEVPTPLRETDVEVTVMVQPLLSPESNPQSLGWPAGFFEQTAGAWHGEPLERGLQGEYELREELA